MYIDGDCIFVLFSSTRSREGDIGDPTGIRTPVTRMRTWRPRPLDDGAVNNVQISK